MYVCVFVLCAVLCAVKIWYDGWGKRKIKKRKWNLNGARQYGF